MYSVGVRDSFMIAHSFKGLEFGPAQGLHGATYEVEVEFCSHALVQNLNWVVDIGEASSALAKVLERYNYKNLDEVDELKGENTTTEFMSKKVFDGMEAIFAGRFHGQLKVTLSESRKAFASYTGIIGAENKS